MNAAERAARNEKALDLYVAGASWGKIAGLLEVTPATAKRAVHDALVARSKDAGDVSLDVASELAQIDIMRIGLWGKARAGDVNAVDRVMRLNERRARLASPTANDHALRVAYDAAVASSTVVTDVDVAIVAAGRVVADRVDEAVATGEGTELTKALYLVPHMVNVLRELMATPAARAAAQTAAPTDGGGSRLAGLRAVESGRGARDRTA